MAAFSIILPNERKNTYTIVTVLISFLNIFGFAYLSISLPESDQSHYIAILGFTTAIPPLLRFLLVKTKLVFPEKIKQNEILKLIYNNPQEDLLMTINIAFFFSALVWLLLGFYAIFFLVFVFASAGIFALRKLKILLNTDSISYPSFPRKKIMWNEVSNLILKDNVLTIDLKNNKLIQQTINENDNEGLDETAFNTFAQQQLNNIPQS